MAPRNRAPSATECHPKRRGTSRPPAPLPGRTARTRAGAPRRRVSPVTRHPLWSTPGYDWLLTIEEQPDKRGLAQSSDDLLAVSDDPIRATEHQARLPTGSHGPRSCRTAWNRLVSGSFARHAWLGAAPVGKRLRRRYQPAVESAMADRHWFGGRRTLPRTGTCSFGRVWLCCKMNRRQWVTFSLSRIGRVATSV